MTSDKSLFRGVVMPTDVPVRGVDGDGGRMRATGVGRGVMFIDGVSIGLRHLYYVPGLDTTLVSISQLVECGASVLISKSFFTTGWGTNSGARGRWLGGLGMLLGRMQPNLAGWLPASPARGQRCVGASAERPLRVRRHDRWSVFTLICRRRSRCLVEMATACSACSSMSTLVTSGSSSYIQRRRFQRY